MKVSANYIGQMNRVTIMLLLFQLTIACKPKVDNGELYVSNHAFDKFDRALMTVTLDDSVIYKDTVTNKYLSFHWDKKSFVIPSDSFRVTVSLAGRDFLVKKDTAFYPGESRQQMFIEFNFYSYYKRYNNPEIYSHVDTGTFDLKKVADSLYENHILKNVDDYLNDTIPLPSDIKIVFKKPEKQVL